MIEKTIAEKVAERKAALDEANKERATLQALDVILTNCEMQPAPHTVNLIDPTYRVVTIGVGKDHTVSLYLTQGDYEALQHLLGADT